MVQSQPGQMVCETPISKKPITKIELVEQLMVKALSSNPSTAKRKRRIESFLFKMVLCTAPSDME
jgi:hypothetical protein